MKPPTEPGTPEQLRQMADIGFLAVHMGEPAAARAIFASLAVLRPDSALPHIGRAMAEQAAGRMDEAVHWLREVALKGHPDNPELNAFLGLALVQAGRPSQAAPVLRRVVSLGTPQDACVRMSLELLGRIGTAAGAPSTAPSVH